MKIAITGGTGFVGRHLAQSLSDDGHQVVLIARGFDERDKSARELKNIDWMAGDVGDFEFLKKCLKGCEAIAHCAGINREKGSQTYQNVHVNGTRHVIKAAKETGIKKIALMSFLRARPNCGSPYHESKWEAEELVRSSGLDYTILKAGVIYGKGDHMLDHLSHTLYGLPIFALVGMKDQLVRPLAINDLVQVMKAALVYNRLPKKTIALMGPEKITLHEAVKRVATEIGKNPLFIRMPLFFHYPLAFILERVMKIPLVSMAQIRILSEGIVESSQDCDPLPEDLSPKLTFNKEQILKGLPKPGSFTLKDLF